MGCGRVAADKSDNVWHWHQACEWAMLKKKNCRSLARGISHGDKFGNLIKKLQKFGTGYFARGQIREPHKKIAEVCPRAKYPVPNFCNFFMRFPNLSPCEIPRAKLLQFFYEVPEFLPVRNTPCQTSAIFL